MWGGEGQQRVKKKRNASYSNGLQKGERASGCSATKRKQKWTLSSGGGQGVSKKNRPGSNRGYMRRMTLSARGEYPYLWKKVIHYRKRVPQGPGGCLESHKDGGDFLKDLMRCAVGGPDCLKSREGTKISMGRENSRIGHVDDGRGLTPKQGSGQEVRLENILLGKGERDLIEEGRTGGEILFHYMRPEGREKLI